MPRFNDAPVPMAKVQLIQDMLLNSIVGQLWDYYVNLGHPVTIPEFRERNIAWHNYIAARDAHLGLPPLKIEGVVTNYRSRLN